MRGVIKVDEAELEKHMTFEALLEKARALVDRGVYSSSTIDQLWQAAEMATKLKRFPEVICSLCDISLCHTQSDELDSGCRTVEKADALAFEKFGKASKERLRPLLILSQNLFSQGQRERSTEMAMLLREIARANNSRSYEGRALRLLAIIAESEGKFEAGLRFCEKALALSGKDEQTSIVILSAMVNCYRGLKVISIKGFVSTHFSILASPGVSKSFGSERFRTSSELFWVGSSLFQRPFMPGGPVLFW